MEKELYPNIYLYKRIVQAKLFIDNNFAEKIDLNNIADEAYFSKFHFVRLFKKIYGKTPHQYLTFVRIENAKKLLQTDIPVSHVCFSVGFESISSFAGLFKKMTGITPSMFQLQQKTRRSEMIQRPLRFIPNCFAQTHGWTKNSNFQEVTL
jgi:AraC-like DNA-binding protein